MESSFQLKPRDGSLRELALTGSFPPRWPGNLTAALAAQNINIVSAHAVKKRFEWDATFVLDLSQFSGDIDSVNFTELAYTEPDDLPDGAVQLTRYALQRLPTGDLEVSISGPDQIGFLARLLRRMTVLTLFPREFDIDTVSGRIKDRIVLGGIGNLMPTPAVMNSLENALQGMTQPAA